MNKELTYSTPEEEGVSSEYIYNFLERDGKKRSRDPWHHDLEKQLELYLKHIMNRIGRKSHILSILLQNVLQIQRRELHIQKDS